MNKINILLYSEASFSWGAVAPLAHS